MTVAAAREEMQAVKEQDPQPSKNIHYSKVCACVCVCACACACVCACMHACACVYCVTLLSVGGHGIEAQDATGEGAEEGFMS